MTQRFPMTVAGEKKLKETIDFLKRIERPRITAAIAEARAHGDLSENAEYHAAKEEQGLTEARLRHLEHQWANRQVVDTSKLQGTDKVVFGATVELLNIATEETVIYQLVGEHETDVKQGKISITSPIARALISKHIGDEVHVQTPAGVVEYEVIEVTYVNSD